MIKFKPVSNLFYSLTEKGAATLVIYGDLEKLHASSLFQKVPDIAYYHIHTNYTALIRDLLANPQIRSLVLIGTDTKTKNVIDNIWNKRYTRDGDYYHIENFPDIKISGKISLEHLQLLTAFVSVYDDEYHSSLDLMPYNKEPIIYND